MEGVEMSKGSKKRPAQISKEEMDRRWEMAFGVKTKEVATEQNAGDGASYPTAVPTHKMRDIIGI
jgi:hypothetical protein